MELPCLERCHIRLQQFQDLTILCIVWRIRIQWNPDLLTDSIKTHGIRSYPDLLCRIQSKRTGSHLEIYQFLHKKLAKLPQQCLALFLKSILFCFLNKKIGPAHAQQNIFCFALLQESVFVHIYSICLKTKQKNSEYQQNLSITGSGQGIVSGKQTFRIYNAAAL